MTDQRDMLRLSGAAFDAAIARLEAVRPMLDAAQAFGPLAECLWWAASIDERLEALESTYKERRANDVDGQLLPGVRWVRNRTGHDQALVLRYGPGAELGRLVLGVSALGTVSELIWRPANELPPGRTTRGREVYETRLQGHPAAETVAAARRWFHDGQWLLLQP